MSIVARVFAVLLVFIHLLNVIGCYFVFKSLETRHTVEVTERLDEDSYAGSEAITLRIPFSLPYTNSNQKNYERVDGKFKHEGEVYRFVKQKFYRDTLFIVCVKDAKAAELDDSIDDITASMTDTTPIKKSSSKTSGWSIKDFDSLTPLGFSSTRDSINTFLNSFHLTLFSCLYSEIIVPPPQLNLRLI